MSIVGPNNRLATPLSQKSGRIVSGPKNPTLPQLLRKFEPINSFADSAPKVAAGSTSHRVRTKSASPANFIGSGRPMNVPKASRKIWSASGRSFSFNGRIVISISVVCPIFRRRVSKRRAESVIEIREVAEARVQSDVQNRFGGGSESQGRFTQPSSQNELMGREADDMLEGSQEMVGADPDERAQFFKTQRPPEMQFDKPNRRRDSTLIPHRRPFHRSWRSADCGQYPSGQFQREFFKIDRLRAMES